MTRNWIISGSTAHRRINCTASAELEKRVVEKVGEEASVYADDGTRKHEIMYECLDKGIEPIAYPDIGEDLEDCQAAWDATQTLIEQYKIDKFDLELSYEHLRSAPGCPGTADFVALGTDPETGKPCTVVADFKFGKGIFVSAEENIQMAFYALGLFENEDPFTTEARRLVFAVVQPWREDGVPTLRTWTTDIAWLEAYRQREVSAYDDITSGNTAFAVGEWCQFCKGRPECPEQNGGLVKIGELDKTPDMLTAVELSSLLELGKRAVEQYKVLQEYATQRAQKGADIPGYKLVESIGNRAWKDAKQAEVAIVSVLGSDAYAKKLISPTQLQKKDPSLYDKLAETHVHRPVTGVKLVGAKSKAAPLKTGDISVPEINKLKE